MKTNNDIEELIAVYLKGEATPEQAMQLDNWRTISQENNSFYLKIEESALAKIKINSKIKVKRQIKNKKEQTNM